jgi:hypothetical protein
LLLIRGGQGRNYFRGGWLALRAAQARRSEAVIPEVNAFGAKVVPSS